MLRLSRIRMWTRGGNIIDWSVILKLESITKLSFSRVEAKFHGEEVLSATLMTLFSCQV